MLRRLSISDFAVIDAVSVGFAGFEQVIDPGSFVRKDDKWEFKTSPLEVGVWRIDLHDDGRFKLQAGGPFIPAWSGEDYFSDPVDLSLLVGPDLLGDPDIGEASVQLDKSLHFRSH